MIHLILQNFLVEDGKIRPPHLVVFLVLVELQQIALLRGKRCDGKFMSIDDLKIRSKAGKSVIEMLTNAGCLEGMSQK